MPLIESEDAANRLARAIVSDVRLYMGEHIARGEDVSDAVQEGRELFQSRVQATLYAVFESAVQEAKLGPVTGIAAARGVVQPPAASIDGTLAPVEREGPSEPLPPGLFQSGPSERRASPSVWLVAFAVLLVAAGFGFWLASH